MNLFFYLQTFILNYSIIVIFFISQKCGNLSEDIQQQCGQEGIGACMGYIQ
jgi:hypothetical protein